MYETIVIRYDFFVEQLWIRLLFARFSFELDVIEMQISNLYNEVEL